MRWNCRCLVLFVLLLVGMSTAAQTVVDSAGRLRLAGEAETGFCASLSWLSIAGDVSYELYRRMPGEESFSPLLITRDTVCRDSLHITLCGDTVDYQVRTVLGDTSFLSNPKHLFFVDLLPTTACALKVLSVNPQTGSIELHWLPSPDADIMGYFLCEGYPCMDFDTVWGQWSTDYVCPQLSTQEVHRFRISAFDSCFTASTYTDVMCNMVLSHEVDACAFQIMLHWTPYEGMPGGVDRYRVVWFGTDGSEHNLAVVGGAATCEAVIVPPVSEGSFSIAVVAEDASRELRSYSNRDTIDMNDLRLQQHMVLLGASVCDDDESVLLMMQVDEATPQEHYRLYRVAAGGKKQAVATLSATSVGQQTYIDRSAHPASSSYLYSLEPDDDCASSAAARGSTASTMHLVLRSAAEPDGLQLVWSPCRPVVSPRYEVWRRAQSAAQWQQLAITTDTAYTDRSFSLEDLSEPMLYKVATMLDAGAYDTLFSNMARYTREGYVWFPNAFTPTSDNNNHFCPSAVFVDASSYRLHIYNRQGLLVFESRDVATCWDGTWRGRPLPQGVYTYKAYCSYADGRSEHVVGSVLLLR